MQKWQGQNEKRKQQTSLQVSSQKTMLPEEINKTIQAFLVEYNPDVQGEICTNSDLCFFGDFPTLAKLKRMGEKTPVAWLVPQLINLSEFCGCKDKLSNQQLKECAQLITANFYYMKVSELMLFFFRFKSGKYGRFYGSIDPLIIMQALRDFAKERNYAYDQHDNEIEAQEREESRQRHAAYLADCKRKGIEPFGGRLKNIGIIKKEKPKYTKEQIKEYAVLLAENTRNYSESTLKAMRDWFAKQFHFTPQGWLDKNAV